MRILRKLALNCGWPYNHRLCEVISLCWWYFWLRVDEPVIRRWWTRKIESAFQNPRVPYSCSSTKLLGFQPPQNAHFFFECNEHFQFSSPHNIKKLSWWKNSGSYSYFKTLFENKRTDMTPYRDLIWLLNCVVYSGLKTWLHNRLQHVGTFIDAAIAQWIAILTIIIMIHKGVEYDSNVRNEIGLSPSSPLVQIKLFNLDF